MLGVANLAENYEASQILQEKVEDICRKIPAFRKEIDWRRGKTVISKDHCKYIFKNGSDFENVAARESSRGRRKHGKIALYKSRN